MTLPVVGRSARQTGRVRNPLGALAAVVCVGVAAVATVASSPPGDVDAAPERMTIDDLDFRGAFRLSSETFGVSDTNYAVGTIAVDASRQTVFIAGHAQHNAIAEFPVPDELGAAGEVDDLPLVDAPVQPFSAPLDRAPTGNPDGIDRINGMYVDEGRLIVNAERWYDASGAARDTTLVLDAQRLDGPVAGYYELDGRVHAGGYLSPIPAEWQDRLGGDLVTGWASNTSIISRHSVGPTLFAVDSDDIGVGDPLVDPAIATRPHLDYPFDGARYLGADALDTGPGGASPLWNFLATARYGFVAPGTTTFVVIGTIGGVESGIGYKITQSDGTLCGGYCSYDAGDEHNAYWLFDLDEILAADEVYDPRPYAFGRWDVPFDGGGVHPVIGGSFDPASGRLYVALGGAGQVGTYDRPPLIVVFDVAAGSSASCTIRCLAAASEHAVRVALD